MMNKDVNAYLKKIDSQFIGEIEDATLKIEGSVCDITGNWKDVVSVYMIIKNGVLTQIKAKCGPCDPYAYTAMNILCRTLVNMKCSEIAMENEEIQERFEKEFSSDMDLDMRFHFERILDLIVREINKISKN